MKKVILAASVLAASALSPAHAGDIYDVPGFPNAIEFRGDIEHGDEDKLFGVLSDQAAKGIQVNVVMLDSPGGFLTPASRMAYTIRQKGLNTVVAQNGKCASACMLIYSGGVEHFAWIGAQLGVHSVSVANKAAPEGFTEDGEGSVDLAREMQYYGAPPAVIGKLVMARPNEMSWLTAEDVKGWVTIKPVEPQTQTQTAGNRWTMTCRSSESGNVYDVVWTDDGIVANGKPLTMNEWHPATKEAGAYVVTGPTKYGNYAAIFAGPNPRMAFANKKGDTAIDTCVNTNR